MNVVSNNTIFGVMVYSKYTKIKSRPVQRPFMALNLQSMGCIPLLTVFVEISGLSLGMQSALNFYENWLQVYLKNNLLDGWSQLNI